MLDVHFLRQMNIGTLFFNFLVSTKLRFFMIVSLQVISLLFSNVCCRASSLGLGLVAVDPFICFSIADSSDMITLLFIIV